MWSPENIVSFLDVDRSETERSEVPTPRGSGAPGYAFLRALQQIQ
jgi:hypothetical protein